uniref:Uncharacterized protein n=1 Tax=Kalanchoe fedtschenkoi TaxID=63787 RepID=A0A7N0TSF5_KALFE
MFTVTDVHCQSSMLTCILENSNTFTAHTSFQKHVHCSLFILFTVHNIHYLHFLLFIIHFH